MNILMMTNTYKPILGGLEKSIQSFTEQYRKQKHNVLIVAPSYEGQPEREFGVVRLPAVKKVSGTDFSINLPIPGLVSKIVRAFKPDIVHAHHPFLIGDMALRLCGQYKIPLVFTYHTLFEHYMHYLPFDQEMAKSFVVQLAAGYANLADCVIAPSESVRRILRRQGIKAPIKVLPTGIQVKKYKQGNNEKFRRQFKIPQDAFLVGHVGRLAPEKNLNFLARAMSVYLRKEKKARFLLAGQGPSRKPLIALFKKRGVFGQCVIPGSLQGRDLLNAYHAMNVFAFTSHSETQGMVLVEAMAAGVPIVALDASGVREAVRDKDNGRLIKKENVKGFVKALREITHMPKKKYEKMKENAKSTALDFELEKSAKKMLRIYESLKIDNVGRQPLDQATWHLLMARIKTEWNMLGNLRKAAEAAIVRPLAAA